MLYWVGDLNIGDWDSLWARAMATHEVRGTPWLDLVEEGY